LRPRRRGTSATTAPAPSSAAQDAATPTLKVQANEVDLVFTVTDKNGRFING